MSSVWWSLSHLRRGDTKGSCVRRYNSDCRCDVTPAWVVHEPWTGMKLDIHSWTEISGSEKRAPHDCHGWSSLSLFKEPFGGILSDTRIVRGEKNTVSVSTNPKVAFAVPRDTRTCHFHRTVGYGANGCRKIRIASRMMMMIMMIMMMMTLMKLVICPGIYKFYQPNSGCAQFQKGGRGYIYIYICIYYDCCYYDNKM